MREVADQIFERSKLEPLLQRVLDFSDETRQKKQVEIEQCEARFKTSRSRLANLHDGIELGTLSARDPDIADRIKERRTEIDGFNETLKVLRQQIERGPMQITSAAVHRFATLIRQKLLEGESLARQRIARAFIREFRVGECIEIPGDKDALAHGAALVARSKGAVPTFDRNWCRLGDSNT